MADIDKSGAAWGNKINGATMAVMKLMVQRKLVHVEGLGWVEVSKCTVAV